MEVLPILHPIRLKRLKNYICHLSGLVAYYPLWEKDGAVAKNYAPRTFNTLNGTTSGATLGQPGQVGKAYSFDGAGDSVIVSDNTVLKPEDAITILFLINPDATQPAYMTPYAKANEHMIEMSSTPNELKFQFITNVDGSDRASDLTATALTADIFSMMAFTYDSADHFQRIYINGVSNKTNELTGLGTYKLKTGGGGDVWFGGRTGFTPARDFTGKMQHVAIFNTALSAGQILKISQIAGLA